MNASEEYLQAAEIAKQIEDELKSLNRWSDHPLSEEKFENMGAFGCNTMSFEQWIQFVLLVRLREIVETKGEFPQSSNVAVYAVRAFDGDTETDGLQNFLRHLDDLINGDDGQFEFDEQTNSSSDQQDITLNSTEIPPVLFTIIDLLPKFEGDQLESQLQSIDSLLQVLHHSTRATISLRMKEIAKEKNLDPKIMKRISDAADAVARGENAAVPYNHEEAMKKYREEHLKSFPDFSYDDEKKD